jgi:hypothetical protein
VILQNQEIHCGFPQDSQVKKSCRDPGLLEPGGFKPGLTLDSVLTQNNITDTRKWQTIDVKMVVIHLRVDFSTLRLQKLKNFSKKNRQHCFNFIVLQEGSLLRIRLASG